MKEELQLKLVSDFPQIFQDFRGDPTKTCMAWGLEVGDGWHDLIRRMCEDVMAMNPPGNFKALQVKEKFGGLRFYAAGGTPEISERIDTAERESYKTCENCGSTENVTSTGSWVTTLCEDCRNK